MLTLPDLIFPFARVYYVRHWGALTLSWDDRRSYFFWVRPTSHLSCSVGYSRARISSTHSPRPTMEACLIKRCLADVLLFPSSSAPAGASGILRVCNLRSREQTSWIWLQKRWIPVSWARAKLTLRYIYWFGLSEY